MAARSSNSLVGIALAVVIVVAVVVGIWRSVAGGAPEGPVGAPVPPVASTPAPYEHHEDEGGAAEETPGPPPTNAPSTGTDADEHSALPAKQQAIVLKRAAEFWKAFSLRDPDERDTALAAVTVPYLAERMSVRSTSRIPVVTPVRSAIVDGTFSQATVVTEATGSSQNNWWYVTLVFDPVPETWSAQAYEQASPGLIAAAKQAMKKTEER